MWAPSRRRKLRTQPPWSDASPFSMWDSVTAGCQRSWLLKSRNTSHTRSIGASMTAERVTRRMASPVPQITLEGGEAGLEDALADRVRQLALLARRRIELGRPLGKSTVAVGDRRQFEGGDVIVDAHRRFEDRVGALVVVVRQAEKLLANGAAVAQPEIADAADAVRRPIAFDPRLGDRRVPFRQTVEVADMGPDGVRRGVDHARRVDLDHEPLPSGLGVLVAALRRPGALVWP